MAQEKQIILIYDGDGGLLPMVSDVVKKTFGFEECPLCEITYSAVGKRAEWKTCEAKLPYAVVHKHRNEIPQTWKDQLGPLPVVALQHGEQVVVLLDPASIRTCKANPACLDRKIRSRVMELENAA